MVNSEDIQEIASRILYCDSSCIVVNKIPGEEVEGSRTAASRQGAVQCGSGMTDLPGQLAAALPAAEPSPPLFAHDILTPPVAAHRLDVPVSGCVLFARTGAALRFLNSAFSGTAGGGKAVEKRYWAVVEAPQDDKPLNDTLFPESANFGGDLVHWIQFDPRRNRSIACDEPGPGRKKAILRCRLAGRGLNYLFLEIESLTGRHHQIRAQLERMGLHIKGDLKYGARRSEKNGGIRLHARSLSFPDPADRTRHPGARRISVQADPPLRDNLWIAFEESLR